MEVLLLFPPPWSNLVAPQAGLGYLEGFLSKKDIKVTTLDLNQKFAYHLLSEETQKEGFQCIVDRLRSGKCDSEFLKWNTYYHSYSIVQKHLSSCINILTGQQKASKNEYKWANKLVEIAFGIACAKYYPDYYSQKRYVTSTSPTDSKEFEKTINLSHGMFKDFYNKMLFSLHNHRFIGISVATIEQLLPALMLAHMLKDINPDCYITLGGTYITLIKDKIFDKTFIWENINSVITGDGEEPLYKLVCNYYNNGSFADVPNLIYLEQGMIKQSELNTFTSVKNLETANYNQKSLEKYFAVEKALPILVDSGCYWSKCAFCCDTYFEHSIENRRNELIIDEINNLMLTYQCNRFDLMSLAVTPLQITNIAKEMIAKNLEIKWQCWSRLDYYWTFEKFNILYKAGCRRISFGLESASQRVLDVMNKGINIKDCARIIEECKKANILVNLFFITGFPTETEDEAWETATFIETNRSFIDTIQHSLFSLDDQSLMNQEMGDYGIKLLDKVDDLNFTSDFQSTIGMSRQDASRVYNEIDSKLNTMFDNIETEWKYYYDEEIDYEEEPLINYILEGKYKDNIPEELRKEFLYFQYNSKNIVYFITEDKYYQVDGNVYETINYTKGI